MSPEKWIQTASKFIALTLSRLIRTIVGQFLWSWILKHKALYQSSGKENENCCFVFPSWTKREIRHFHVVVVQRRQTNVQKSVMHVQSCYFANLNLLVYSRRSRCRRRRLCLSSLLIKVDTTVYFAATYPRYVSGGKKSCIMARTSGTSFSIRNRHAFGPASKV